MLKGQLNWVNINLRKKSTTSVNFRVMKIKLMLFFDETLIKFSMNVPEIILLLDGDETFEVLRNLSDDYWVLLRLLKKSYSRSLN